MASAIHYHLKAISLKQHLVWRKQVECMFQGQGKGAEEFFVWQLSGILEADGTATV